MRTKPENFSCLVLTSSHFGLTLKCREKCKFAFPKDTRCHRPSIILRSSHALGGYKSSQAYSGDGESPTHDSDHAKCRGVYKYDSVDSVSCHIPYIGRSGTRVFLTISPYLWSLGVCPLGHIMSPTGHTPVANEGVLGSKPPSGGIWKICKFSKKKSLSRVSRPRYHNCTIGRAHTKNIPRAQPPKGYRWGARAPQNVIFVDYISRILRNAPFYFRVTSHVDSLSMRAFFAVFGMGVRYLEHPQNWYPKNPGFPPQFLTPLECPHKKMCLLPNFTGAPSPTPWRKQHANICPQSGNRGPQRFAHLSCLGVNYTKSKNVPLRLYGP